MDPSRALWPWIQPALGSPGSAGTARTEPLHLCSPKTLVGKRAGEKQQHKTNSKTCTQEEGKNHHKIKGTEKAQAAFYFTFCQQSHCLRVAFPRQRSSFWETSNTEISFLLDVKNARPHWRHSFSHNSASSWTEKELSSVVMSLASQPERPGIRGKKSAYKFWLLFLFHWSVNNVNQNVSRRVNMKVFVFT